jgi:putative DNA methylase
MSGPKRLIEVDLPIRRISIEARREKAIRHGHISTMHIWWARRPLAACRAVALAALIPDPADPECPVSFRRAAADSMREWRDMRGGPQRDWNDPMQSRAAILEFIADFSNWDNASEPGFLAVARRLVDSAHVAMGGESDTKPLVVDSFAGGGSIPLEALRIGADAFASDLNPVAVLLERVLLEEIPRHGMRLSEEFQRAGERVAHAAEQELKNFYPEDPDGSQPVAYLWARTVISDAPGEVEPPVEIPMLTTMSLSERANDRVALRWVRDEYGKVQTASGMAELANGRRITVRRPCLEVYRPGPKDTVEAPPVRRGAATCPVTNHTMPAERIRTQFGDRRGGADDARLIVVVLSNVGRSGKTYRLPMQHDLDAVTASRTRLDTLRDESIGGLPAVPDEELPYLRSIFNINLLGVDRWGDLFTARQALALTTIARMIREMSASATDDLTRSVRLVLALSLGRQADYTSSLCLWSVNGEFIAHTFGRQALPIVWDFAEVAPFGGGSGDFAGALEWVRRVIDANARGIPSPGKALIADAAQSPLADDSCDLFFTDPPYYDAVPYADLSDFFYVWLRRSVGDLMPDLFDDVLTPKRGEIVQLAERNTKYAYKTKDYFQSLMQKAMAEGRRVLRPGGIGVVVFAHKTTTGWEAQLESMLAAGWTVTGSWPIDTELASRLRAQNSAVLASSVHLVCRPRESSNGRLDETSVGDWRDVLAALPVRIHDWLPRLATEGIVGADAIFACIGPALEIFSQYSRVEKANGDVVHLREYLEHVWAAVAREALALVIGDADASSLEEDARLTAMWLWTLRGTSGVTDGAPSGEDEVVAVERRSGYVLEYDAARKIAQGLGANLDALSSIVEVKGEIARLRSVRERGGDLVVAVKAERRSTSDSGQMALFAVDDPATPREASELLEPAKTVLDRLHQAMILFASGRSDVLERFLSSGAGSDSRFWSLGQSLSALYPLGTDEKRWVDGVLARKKAFGY